MLTSLVICVNPHLVPYIGCDTVAGALASDKAYTKALAVSLGKEMLLLQEQL